MPLNKQAVIRYQVLDQCFANRHKRFYIEDLLEACNKALYEYCGLECGVNKRQLYDDIRYMESPQGWNVSLERVRDGKRVYFRYEDPAYSINRTALGDAELNQLQALLVAVKSIKGLPDIGGGDGLVDALRSKFHIDADVDGVVGIEQNRYLAGLEHFGILFNSIVNRQCLTLGYRTYSGVRYQWTIHPYYLKQYNSRWFLLGLNEEGGRISTLPLDRIVNVEFSGLAFRDCDIDFDEYFDDVIGVTVREDAAVETVVLRFSPVRFPYVETKPLHPSQKVLDRESCLLSIEVIPNNELVSLLLSFGSDVEVCAPQPLRNAVLEQLRGALKNY